MDRSVIHMSVLNNVCKDDCGNCYAYFGRVFLFAQNQFRHTVHTRDLYGDVTAHKKNNKKIKE